jgi:SAM-dependent methyltransferase
MAQVALPCPVCGAQSGRLFAELPAVPVYCNVLWPTREDALRAPRGDVRLASCGECGMIWNDAFDATQVAYSPAYENSLHFSSVFGEYAEALASRLIARYDLEGKDIVDIGAGKGEFLTLLCRGGRNRGVGFDPSYDGEAEEEGSSVRFVRDLYGEPYADTPADFVCCRHVLEHIEDPRAFLRSLRRTLSGSSDVVVYFEVPAAEYVLGELSIWDVIYEHCSLFSLPALRLLFEEADFCVLDVGFSFGGQYLWIEATPGAARPGDRPDAALSDLDELVDAFQSRLPECLDTWEREVEALTERGPLALWGAGSKGVTFLNLVASDKVAWVVDVNPRKRGRHVAGVGHRVIDPSELGAHPPATILIMNPVYASEIQELAAAEGVTAELVVV